MAVPEAVGELEAEAASRPLVVGLGWGEVPSPAQVPPSCAVPEACPQSFAVQLGRGGGLFHAHPLLGMVHTTRFTC